MEVGGEDCVEYAYYAWAVPGTEADVSLWKY